MKEGYQDTEAWSVNVDTRAVTVGLYKGLESVDMSVALSRDNAAQMIWNALNANQVVYLTTTTGALDFRDTLLVAKFGAAVDTGIMTKITYNRDTKEYTYTIDGDKKYTTTADYTDLFAMNVSVLAKGSSALGVRVDEGGVGCQRRLGRHHCHQQ